MNKAHGFMKGYCVLEIRGASPQQALNNLVKAGIAFWNVEWIDILSLRITIFPQNLQRVQEVVESAMCESKQIEEIRFIRHLDHILQRPVFLGFVILCLLCVSVLPRFVFFFEVVGNDSVPSERILQELEKIGVGFGTYGPNIRPHWIKNRLLYEMPELQWVTITQNGCRATVVVRERPQVIETETKKGFANVIASQSGIITKQSVVAGQAQFQVGDTVRKGDVLVSGIVDLERIYVIENAKAEIFARTWRTNCVCIPSSYIGKSAAETELSCIWLIVGDKRIKIFGNSGISYGSCDKMKSKLELTLPEGLSLPVSLEIERITFYDTQERSLRDFTAQQILETYALSRVSGSMQAGEILRSQYLFEEKNGTYLLNATLECHEMIAESIPAKWKNEEILHDGTNS